MKKPIALVTAVVLIASTVFLSCEKKKSTGISPDYGATGNPNPNNQTVTGANTFSNPATQNTSILVGNVGWSNPTCGSTGSVSLKGVSGNTDVTLNFASAITAGTYAIGSPAASGVCAMTIVNAPNQPAGIVWVGKQGTVVVKTNSVSINATFSGVVCTQQTFNFPTVNASGTLSCSQ